MVGSFLFPTPIFFTRQRVLTGLGPSIFKSGFLDFNSSCCLDFFLHLLLILMNPKIGKGMGDF